MAGIFKNNIARPVKDLHTGKVYPSKSQAGKELASEFGLDGTDSLVWYQIVKILRKSYPGRIIEVETGLPVELR